MSSSLHLACILPTQSPQTKSLLSTSSTPTFITTKTPFSPLPCKLQTSHIASNKPFHVNTAISASTTNVGTSSDAKITLTDDQWATERDTLLQQIEDLVAKTKQLSSQEGNNETKRPLLKSILNEFYTLGTKIFELEPKNSTIPNIFVKNSLMGLESNKEEVPATLIDVDGVVPIDPNPKPGKASNVVDQLVQNVAKTYFGDTLNEPQYYLTGNFAPIRQETPPTILHDINGEIPKSLNGMMLRNGPDPQFDPEALYSWMDGDSMIHGIKFKDGTATYVSRYAGTSRYIQEGDFDRSQLFKYGDMEGDYGIFASCIQILRSKFQILDMSYGYTNSNTGLVYHSGRIMALEDFGQPYAINVDDTGDIKTLGINNYRGVLDHWFTPHPKKDPITGEMFAFGSMYTEPYCIYNVIAKDGLMSKPVPITMTGPSYNHDMGLTEHHVIFMDLPYVFSPETMIEQNQWIYTLDPKKKARFGILPRYASSEEGIKWFEFTDDVPFFIFHNGNAWEDDNGNIVMYSCLMNPGLDRRTDMPFISPSIARRSVNDYEVELTLPNLYKLTFNMNTGECTREKMADTFGDYPKINESYMGRPTRYMYMSEANTSSQFISIVKYDLNAPVGENETKLQFDEGVIFGGEVVFVPKSNTPTSEDDGYLITFVHNETTVESYVYVIDALTMDIVSTIGLPNRVPYGFHAIYVTEDELEAQKSTST